MAKSVLNKKALAEERARELHTADVGAAEHVLHLIVQAEDRAHDLRYVQQAFSAFAKLVCAEYENPRAQLEADRGELTALLELMNKDATHRIASLIAAVETASKAARMGLRGV